MGGMFWTVIVCLIISPGITFAAGYRLGRQREREERWAAMIAFRRIQRGPARGRRRFNLSHLN